MKGLASFNEQCVQVQYEMGLPGGICMDAPKTQTFAELKEIASDRDVWASLCPGKQHDEHTVTKNTATQQQQLQPQPAVHINSR